MAQAIDDLIMGSPRLRSARGPYDPADVALLRLGELLDQAYLAHCRAAAPALDRAFDEVRQLQRQIELTPARTIAGLRVKARAAATCFYGGEDLDITADSRAGRLAQSIIEDLLAVEISG